jgi:hypothetical protein
MSAVGRNEPCPCGSGRKTKRCCGARRGPSDAELATAFLAARSREAAVRLVRYGLDDIHDLVDDMLDLPARHLALQLPLPRLFPPRLEALRTVIEHDGDASDELVDSALACVDSPQQRAALARAVLELAASGAIDRDLADTVVVDLNTDSSSFMRMSLLYAVSVLIGATHTPSGLVVVAR